MDDLAQNGSKWARLLVQEPEIEMRDNELISEMFAILTPIQRGVVGRMLSGAQYGEVAAYYGHSRLWVYRVWSRALRKLRAKDRVVYELMAQGYTPNEIAVLLQVTPDAVYKLIKRGALAARERVYSDDAGDYNANTVAERISKVSEIRLSGDTEALLALDELYVGLYSLVMLSDADPDYMGIRDQEIVDQIIRETIERLPEQAQQNYLDEVASIRKLLDEKKYGEARERVANGAEQVADLISDGKEPPERVQKIFDELSASIILDN